GCMEMAGRSIGVGFEAGWLLGRGRPVVALYDADVAPASSVVRFPPFDHCVPFGAHDLTDLGAAVTDFCRTIAAHAAYSAEGYPRVGSTPLESSCTGFRTLQLTTP